MLFCGKSPKLPLLFSEQPCKPSYGEQIAVLSEAADDPRADGRDHRMMPELLALVDVGDVHLDKRLVHRGDSVAQSDGVVGVSARIEHTAVVAERYRLNSVDEVTLMV